uniref:CSON006374 protein n=1 Tax=Culicoides sonorensis TaxID=179676 RepID=A0A336LWK8_CULSO
MMTFENVEYFWNQDADWAEIQKKNCIKAVARKKSGPKFELSEEQKNDVLEAFQIFDTEGKVKFYK